MEVQTTQPLQKFTLTEPRSWSKFSKTDLKTYSVIVLSFLLITLGSIITCSSIAITMLPPMVPLTGGPFLCLLGLFLLKKSHEPQSSSSSQIQPQLQPTLHNPGEPLGIHREGFNCWANSALQLIFNLEDLKPIIESSTKENAVENALKGNVLYFGLKKLIQYYKIYKSERENSSSKTVSIVDSQVIRKHLKAAMDIPAQKQKIDQLEEEMRNCTNKARKLLLKRELKKQKDLQPITSFFSNAQEDPWEFFRYFLDKSNFYQTKVIERCTLFEANGEIKSDNQNTDTYDIKEAFSYSLIPFADREEITLEELMAPFFSKEHIPGTQGQHYEKSIRIEEPPQKGFFLQIKRTLQHTDENNRARQVGGIIDGDKISTKVHAPLNLNISQERFGEDAEYACEGFILQSGSLNNGHYIAYVFRQGQWWELNDKKRTKLSITEVEEKLPDSTIIYYKKI